MSFIDLEKKRFSVRAYSDKPVEEEKLQKILEAGRLAPTACNYQPQKIYVLKSEEALAKIRKVTYQAKNAPVVLMVCYDRDISWKNAREEGYDGGEVDGAIVTSMMMMEATELGLSTLWARGFNANEVAKAFGLPENIKIVCLLLLGYLSEDEPGKRTTRKALEETVTIL